MNIDFNDKKATIEALYENEIIGVFETGGNKFYTFNPYYFEDDSDNDFFKTIFSETKWRE